MGCVRMLEVAFLLSLLACSGDSGGGAADSADLAETGGAADVDADSEAVDLAPADLPEVSLPDVPAGDARSDPDARRDADTASDARPELVFCDYLDVEIVLMQCAGQNRFLRRWADVEAGPEACPDYWALEPEDRYASMEEAAAAASCGLDCVWSPTTAVMFLHCGRRDEYITWEPRGESCPTLLQFVTGFYNSLEDYQAATPCPCGADQILLEWPTSGYMVDYQAEDQNAWMWVTSDAGTRQIAQFVAGEIDALGLPGGAIEGTRVYNPGYSYYFVPDAVAFDPEWDESCDALPCSVELTWETWEENGDRWCPLKFEEQAIYDCTGGDGTSCEQVWPRL